MEMVDQESDTRLLSELFALVDDEVHDNLASGPPFSSAAFIQERLNAFGDAWGGAAFKVVSVGRGTRAPAMVVLFTVTRGGSLGSLRFYRREVGRSSLLATATHDGLVEIREWPDAGNVLAIWSGPEVGQGSRPLQLDLWGLHGASPMRVWSTVETFPGGLKATGVSLRTGQLVIRYEVQYPGWKPGCPDGTEQEDVLGWRARGIGLTLLHRRVVNGWHRDLQSAVTRLYRALGTDDRRTIAELVADPLLRARLPRELRAEPVCDARDPARPSTVVVAATREHDQQREAWSLTWRGGARGWRLAAAAPVLQ